MNSLYGFRLAQKYVTSYMRHKRKMWLCGLEILEYYPDIGNAPNGRGGCAISFRAVGREIGRKDITVKRWVDLVKEAGTTEEDWDNWIMDATIQVAKRWYHNWLSRTHTHSTKDTSWVNDLLDD